MEWGGVTVRKEERRRNSTPLDFVSEFQLDELNHDVLLTRGIMMLPTILLFDSTFSI